jgi:VanZ family protein
MMAPPRDLLYADGASAGNGEMEPRDVMTRQITQVTAWLLLAATIILTLGPASVRPSTGVEHHFEHLIAFALVGLMFGLGYPSQRVGMALVGVMTTAALELLQLWAPGRHARFIDFVMNAAGVCLGLAIAAMLERVRRQQTS